MKQLHASTRFAFLESLKLDKSNLELPLGIREYDFPVNTKFRLLSMTAAPPQNAKAVQRYLSKVDCIESLRLDDEQLTLLQNEFFANFVRLQQRLRRISFATIVSPVEQEKFEALLASLEKLRDTGIDLVVVNYTPVTF